VGGHCVTSVESPDAPRSNLLRKISEDRQTNRDKKGEYIQKMANSGSGTKNYGFAGHRRSVCLHRNFPDFQQDLLSLARMVPVKERPGLQIFLENCAVHPS